MSDRRFLDFLEETVPRRGRLATSIRIMEEMDPARESEVVEAARKWQAALDDAGLSRLDEGERARFEELAADFDLPDRSPLLVGNHILTPAIAAYGDDQLKERYLPRLRRGELLACQLFSEPGAGSDLASVRTTATYDADRGSWILNGQKVWSSNAQIADVGEALVRTDARAPKHEGMSLFVVDMHAPGVEVRPLRQMTGGASFNEVFLTDVEVPDADRIGPVGAGWRAAIASLSGERAALGGSAALPESLVPQIVQCARLNNTIEDSAVRERIARLTGAFRAARLFARRAADGQVDAAAAGPVGKMLVVRALALAVETMYAVEGEAIVLRDDPELAEWADFVLSTPAFRIAGGTDEIQRSLLGERVLGLPRDPR